MSRPFNTSRPLGQRMAADGWSVRELAAVSGVDARILSDLLAGRRKPTAEHVKALCAAFDCLPSDIF